MQVPITEWDERNKVAVRYIDDAGSIAHSAVEDLEYVIASGHRGGLPLRCLYSGSKSETLIVVFHGSLQRSKFALPRFEWRRTLEDVEAGRLFVADSTLELSEGMPLGWYIGPAAQDLADEIAAVIEQVAAEGGYRRVVLTGSSGGGFAAMAVSRRIPGSVAVSFSPQTRVGAYVPWVYQSFVKAAFPDHATINEVEAEFPERVNLCRLYAEPEIPNYVRYVQNTNDPSHVDRHYAPFAATRLIDASTGGLDASGRVRLVLEEMQKGHQPPPRGRFLRHIREAYEEFFGIPWTLTPGSDDSGADTDITYSLKNPEGEEVNSRSEPVENAGAEPTPERSKPVPSEAALLPERFSAAVCGLYVLFAAGVVVSLWQGALLAAVTAGLLLGMLILVVQLDSRRRMLNNQAVVREQIRAIRWQTTSTHRFLERADSQNKSRFVRLSRVLAAQSKRMEEVHSDSTAVLSQAIVAQSKQLEQAYAESSAVLSRALVAHSKRLKLVQAASTDVLTALGELKNTPAESSEPLGEEVLEKRF